MTSDKKSTETASHGDLASKDGHAPEWANGLKQLYDSVVDEPLPDAFKDLLDKLDDVDPAGDAPNAAERGGDS